MADDETPVTREEFDHLKRRYDALLGVVKILVQNSYAADRVFWERCLDAVHNQAAAQTDGAGELHFRNIASLLELFITTPRDPEVGG